MIFDILSILPYKIMIQKNEDIFSLRDYLNLLKLLKIAKYFFKTDRKILYHSADSKNT